MKTLSLSLLACLGLLLFTACGKDDEPEKPDASVYTEAELSLHAGATKYWLLHQELFDGRDITSSYKSCEKDDVHTFDTYGNYNIDAGVSKCSDNPEPDLVRGYFKLDEENQTIELGYQDTVFNCTLLKLATDELGIEYEVEGTKVQKTYKPQ